MLFTKPVVEKFTVGSIAVCGVALGVLLSMLPSAWPYPELRGPIVDAAGQFFLLAFTAAIVEGCKSLLFLVFFREIAFGTWSKLSSKQRYGIVIPNALIGIVIAVVFLDTCGGFYEQLTAASAALPVDNSASP